MSNKKNNRWKQRQPEAKKQANPEHFQPYLHYDLSLEKQILGCLLITKTPIAVAKQMLKPAFFYSSFHQSVFQAMIDMDSKAIQLDIVTIINFMGSQPEVYLEKLPPDSPLAWEITRLTNEVVSDAHLPTWMMMVRDMYVARRLAYWRTVGVGELTASNVQEQLQAQQEELRELANMQVKQDYRHISEIIIEHCRYMQEVKGQDLIGVPTGFTYFDYMTGGITPGLYYVGARPSVGKTALAAKWAIYQGQANYPVGIISLETKGRKLVSRMLAQVSGMSHRKIERGLLTDDEMKAFYPFIQSLAEAGIYISDEPTVNVDNIRGIASKMVRNHGLRILYIDYLQLVEPDGGAGTREQEVAAISRQLKVASMELDIPIVVLAQLSRESEKQTGDKKPKIINLRESGSTEQDADGVILIHRDYKSGILINDAGESTEFEADIMVEKWRDGETFKYKVEWVPSRMEYKELEEEMNPFG